MSSKLGYTFYPKDWQTNDDVFELNLEQRAVYRELIDLAMTNDNKVEFKLSTWSRKLGVTIAKLEELIKDLILFDLVVRTDDELYFIPSCEKRLNLKRGGAKGGKKSSKNKPIVKPIVKPTLKPMIKQGEKKENRIEEEDNIITTKDIKNIDVVIDNSVFVSKCKTDMQWIESLCMNNKVSEDAIKLYISHFENHLIAMEEQKKTSKQFKEHFSNWINKQDLSQFRTKVIGKTNQV